VSFIGKHKHELDTPCLLIDSEKLMRNLLVMQKSVVRAGKNLRPHAKTHKCSEIARKQIDAGAVGVCTAKLAEAEVLADRGLDQILITGPVVLPLKAERLLILIERCPSIMVVVDDLENAQLLDRACKKRNLRVDVLLDIDPGLQRTGVSLSDACELGSRIMELRNLNLRGVQAYAGQVQHVYSYAERRDKSLACMLEVQEVFRALKESGMKGTVFTGAGTGTFDIDTEVEDLTDLQVGSYALMDAEYRSIGSADDERHFTLFEPALTMLTSVVSSNQDEFVTVDAGLKSMYRDGATPVVLSPSDREYNYDWFGDEYGKISFRGGRKKLKPGSVFELIVSHCDPTVNQFDFFFVTEKERVVEVWPVDLRGKSQ
jgi:D-serine deaminase-like pyridoxal phosphate-dependent protein